MTYIIYAFPLAFNVFLSICQSLYLIGWVRMSTGLAFWPELIEKTVLRVKLLTSKLLMVEVMRLMRMVVVTQLMYRRMYRREAIPLKYE